MKTTHSSNTSSRWWWKKRTSFITKKPTPVTDSSIHSTGANEDASIFTLYSYTESLIAPPSLHNRASSSLYVQHTKSEYSGTLSDVESNASIWSKPWTSQEIILSSDINIPEDEQESLYQSNLYTEAQPSTYTSTAEKTESNKRRGSLVDFIVNTKIKVVYYMILTVAIQLTAAFFFLT